MVRKIKPYYCDNCGKGLRGNRIPKKKQEFFGVTHFGLEIGYYDIEKDRTTHYECPFCKYKWKV